MKDIVCLFLLKALASKNSSSDPLDNINLFICKLSEGLIPSNSKKIIYNDNISIIINNISIILNKSDNSDELYRKINELYNLSNNLNIN